MPVSRTFNVVLVSADKPVGYAGMQTGYRTVRYTGQAIRVGIQ
jgi:hypothetical protein